MPKLLLPALLFVLVLASCVAATHSRTSAAPFDISTPQFPGALHETVDDTMHVAGDVAAGKAPGSLMDLPRTREGAFVLMPGFYEADFRTYCLQPGTPGPTERDVYFQAPLQGPRKEIIATILQNSRKQSHLDQRNVQLLLWSVVSRSQFQKLSPEVQSTAWQLLSPKQVFELNGGVLGAARAVTRMLPSSGFQNSLQQLFDLGTTSYEAYERLAVLSTPSRVSRPHYRRDQWYRHNDGYYVRYLPHSYKQTKIQVYVPEGAVDTTAQQNYIVFDPSSMVLHAANSDAQRLGVGGPVKDVAGKVIDILESRKESPRPKDPRGRKTPPKDPKEGKTPPKDPNGQKT